MLESNLREREADKKLHHSMQICGGSDTTSSSKLHRETTLFGVRKLLS